MVVSLHVQTIVYVQGFRPPTNTSPSPYNLLPIQPLPILPLPVQPPPHETQPINESPQLKLADSSLTLRFPSHTQTIKAIKVEPVDSFLIVSRPPHLLAL